MSTQKSNAMTTYVYREDSGYDERFDAVSDEAAEARAEELLREGDWNQDSAEKSFRVRASVGRVSAEPDGTEDIQGWRTVMVQLDPVPPQCSGRQQAHDFDGGPSYGSGGGVKYTDTCRKCRLRRTTDTWATDPADGTPFTAVSYEAA